MSRGNAIIEVLVVGMILMLVAMQVVVGFGRMQIAGDEVTQAAQAAATWAARSGSAEDAAAVAQELAPGATVESWQEGRRLHVIVRQTVAVVGPEGGPLSVTVVGRGSAAISQYRSDG